jgi:hypothetical protein
MSAEKLFAVIKDEPGDDTSAVSVEIYVSVEGVRVHFVEENLSSIQFSSDLAVKFSAVIAMAAQRATEMAEN